MIIPFIDPQFNFQSVINPNVQHQLVKSFFDLDISRYNQSLKTKSQRYWISHGQKKALHLFYQAARYVPAYKDFLKKHQINPLRIKTYHDFQYVPVTDKPNYILKYPLEQLTWHGRLDTANIVSFSSGSTGIPFLWPRGTYQDFEGAFQFEHLLTYLFQIDKLSTLLVDCFSMGNYVAGTYVFNSTKLIAQKGYPLTVITPGLQYQDAINMLRRLRGKYEQIILCGYPPFLRNIIDIANEQHLNLAKLKLRFFFASEFFSETWRNHTLSLTGKRNPLIDSTNIYGTADSAIFSFETPLTILIRKLTESYPNLGLALYHSRLIPTLTQYNPVLTHYESINNHLILTSASGIPLIRYDLKDNGNILTSTQIRKIFSQQGVDLFKAASQAGISHTLHNLPFVYLTNRTDNAVSFYAILIFPEYVRGGIEHPLLKSRLSGRFTLVSENDSNQEPVLSIHVELNPGKKITPTLEYLVLKQVTQSLREKCSEYSFLEKAVNNRAKPKIILHHSRQSKYFKIGVKQKWIQKN
ncbi:hypothetical protein A2W24_05355 [Microgenomates group bacterium RBG_16_45_19]|nr:MAG: hypothetical protein A2W24_05355 [Microgenomates group bacterium RBG_16_45_19]